MHQPKIDRARGDRLKQAMTASGHRKATALAAELSISPAAITKWTQGHAMSVDHARNLAALLNVSLDWLLMGRNGPDWLRPGQLSELEIDLIGKLRERPTRITKLLIGLTTEMPKVPLPEQPKRVQP
ncbi:helix-turn-helix domain-containing protein [Pararhizobium sp.]|uniref:helix-turn-helix domain-containing protein n=1 Tax=Pararhizobium sp. TaxID=1977563 RepID=UPI003D113A04